MDNYCVCCGAIIPEGRQVCLICEASVMEGALPLGSITLNFWQFIAAFIAAMGIPSAVMGLIIWRLERKIAKRESNAEEHAKAQEDLFLLLIQSTAAAIALGEATAKAVQRIPDAHCNGDMHAALNYAAEIKHKQKDFLAAQGIHALHQDGK